MDAALLEWFNSWNGASEGLDTLVSAASGQLVVKSLPFMIVFWGLWFWPKNKVVRTGVRESLVATLFCSVIVMGVARAIANFAPFSLRPIHTPGIELKLQAWQSADILDGWSSMPSDHASLFMGLAVAILTIHRRAGLFLIFWAVFFSSLPRIVIGMHWPSDVFVGWLLGATTALLFVGPLAWLVRRTKIVPFFEARETIGYPLLFFATFEVAQMFETLRWFLKSHV